MRYIQKGEEPEFMRLWKEQRLQNGLKCAYDEFDQKKKLNESLRKEQHGICCYCQQRLDHFQGMAIGGSLNEHLIPENGPEGDFDKQMDYTNIFACCMDSKGYKKRERNKRHCDESKGHKRIRGFIQEPSCSSFFRYNSLGQIIPNGRFNTWDEYIAHRDESNGDIKDAIDAIEVLNLNCHQLTDDRKRDLDALLMIIKDLSREKVKAKMIEFEKADQYHRYIDMLLYFMAKKK